MGIAGVDGNGQRELAEAIAGQRSLAAGDIRLFGHSLAKFKVAQREKLGLRYVTDDRLHEGTVGAHVGGDEHRAEADRQAALLGARPHPQRDASSRKRGS